MSDYSKSLRFTRIVHEPSGKVGETCDDCEVTIWTGVGGTVGGDVLRGHRRRCPVNPQEVYTPGVCDS